MIVDHNLNLIPLSTEQPTRENKDKERGRPQCGQIIMSSQWALSRSIVSAANEQPVCQVLSLTAFRQSKFDERTDGQEQASC